MTVIVITGASSGIGQALAEHYATTAGVRLFLSGRDTTRLEAVA
ncbi:MAG TPA: SDR family NAD(P)-dependent oxidoreductase, partial [Alphaproteobacteria bacterium]